MRSVFGLLLCASLGACAGVQQNPLPSPYLLEDETGLDWSQPPASAETQVKLPKVPVVSFELESGLRVSVVEQPKSTVTSLRLWVPAAGGDPRGAVSVMVDALRAGTQLDNNSVLVNPKLSRHSIEAETAFHGSTFSWTVLSRATRPALTILNAFVRRPLFLGKETLERIRESLNRLQRYSVSLAYFEDLARNKMPGIEFERNDDLAHMMLSLSSAELANIHRCRVLPEGAALVVSGAVTSTEVEAWVRESFSDWTGQAGGDCTAYPRPTVLKEDPLERPEVFVLPTASPEPFLSVMYPAPAPTDPDYLPFVLVSHAMAMSQNGVASALRHSGATYGLHADVDSSYLGQSMLTLSGAIRPNVATESLRQIVQTLKVFSTTVEDQDIVLAKQQIATSMVAFASSTSGITWEVLDQLKQGYTPTDASQALRTLLNTTPERCRAVAKKWTDGVNPVVLAASPPILEITSGLNIGARNNVLRSREAR